MWIAVLFASFVPAFHEGHAHAQPDDAQWQAAPVPAKPTFVGQGLHRYRWNPSWLQMPLDQKWLGSTHGCITMDRHDNVYLSADTGAALLIYDSEGKHKAALGADWGGGLHGLSIVTRRKTSAGPSKLPLVVSGQWPSDDARWKNYEQTLWIAHTARKQAMEVDLKGKVLRTIGFPKESGKYENPGQYNPTSVAVGPNGTLFVADGYGQSWVHRFLPDGTYLDSFGGRGEGDANMHTPHGLWMDWNSPTPTLLVADRERNRLARYSLEGKFLGQTEAGLLRRPCHVQFYGGLGVVSDLSGRITLIDQNLKLVAHLGDNSDQTQWANYGVKPKDWREGACCAPH
ncbi:MAG: hypothetical protein P1V35_00005, partial [Planctomycetota bacterium]|nr:hypothetical protein [Planctomycetota bacterium]